jgi:hypothetical protein
MARMIELDAISKSDDARQWDEWLNGKPWIFDQGIDYFGSQDSFIKHVRYQARKRGLKINLVHRNDDSFTVIACELDQT